MKLSELLRGVTIEEVRGEIPGLPGGTLPAATLPGALDAIEIAEVRDDSRQVGSGDLFFALPGQHVDGHAFVTDVKQRGAAAVIVERLQPAASAPLQLRVKSAARALGLVAANRYGRPADVLRLVAITGTNGKTTTTHLVEAMLEEVGQPTGLLGTITYRFRDKSWPAPFTTPTALIFHKTLAELRGVIDEAGGSPFWDGVAGRFFGMNFQQADQFNAVHGNQFIADLMPKHPVYTAMLPESARAVIGMPLMDRRLADRVEEVALIRAREYAEGDGCVGRAEGGGADLRDLGPLRIGEDGQAVDVRQFPLVGRHAVGGVALDVLDRAVVLARREFDVARGHVVLQVDEDLAAAAARRRGGHRVRADPARAAHRRRHRFTPAHGAGMFERPVAVEDAGTGTHRHHAGHWAVWHEHRAFIHPAQLAAGHRGRPDPARSGLGCDQRRYPAFFGKNTRWPAWIQGRQL